LSEINHVSILAPFVLLSKANLGRRNWAPLKQMSGTRTMNFAKGSHLSAH